MDQQESVGKIMEIQLPTTSFDTVGKVMEISHEELLPMPEKSAFMFHHNFYPWQKIDLKDAEIFKRLGKITNIATQL